MKRITFHVLQNINNAEKGDRNISEKSVDYDDQCFSQESTDQVIRVLGAQRLMGPKVVYFLSEKFLGLLRPTILLCRKRQIIIRSITGNQNREIGEELENFRELHTETPRQKYKRRAKDPRQKKLKIIFNSHADMVTKWLHGSSSSKWD